VKKKDTLWLKAGAVIGLIIFAGIFVSYFGEKNMVGRTIVLENPVTGLSIEEAVLQFDENYLTYLLYSLDVQKLHNPPFSSNTPKIEIYVGEEVYGAQVFKGRIFLAGGFLDEKDIIIRTSSAEVVKMLRNRNYVADSFNSGGSSVELISGKVTLMAKGYFELYNKFTGKK